MKKFTLSHRVVAVLFLVVMVLLLTIAYIGSQQTQVYRGRATYGGPTPTTIGAPSSTPASCPFVDIGACYSSGCSNCVTCVGGGARCIVNPSPTTGGAPSNTPRPQPSATPPLPTPMCPYANLAVCQQSGCTSCAGCPDRTFTCGGRYVTSTPRPPTPTNPFRPTATPTPRYGGYPTNTPRLQPSSTPRVPTATPQACVPQSGACCGCGLRVNTCTGVCDRSATGGCQNWCGVPTATRSPSATPRPRPSNTPAVRPSPTEEPGSPTVLGDVNVADCTQITGWSGDTDDPNRANRIRIYADGNKSHGTLLGTTRANYARERAICRALGGSNCGVCPANEPQCKHGFVFTVPASLKDGNPHTIYTYGLNLNETPGRDKKIGETKTITCTLTQPSSTPTVSGPTPTTGALSPTPTVSGPTPTTSPTCGTKASGDANCDGVIDGIDYVMWLNSQCNPGANQTCADVKADFNGDGKVNDDDYQIWFNNRT